LKLSFSAARMTGLLLLTGSLLGSCSPLPVKELTPPVKAAVGAVTETALTCEDFLEKWDKKPPQLEFIGCEKTKSAGGSDILLASYRVTGAAAAQVENALIQDFDMVPLRFLCCGWENHVERSVEGVPNTTSRLDGHGGYKDENGFGFQIDMYSAETLVTERSEWAEIPTFNVLVEAYLGGA
jgi:hypothetical protein